MTASALQNLETGLTLHQQGDLEEAARYYCSVLEQDPGAADAWNLLARVWLGRRDFRRAQAAVLAAIRLRSDVAAFHATLGDILAGQGRARDAALCFEEAVRQDPRAVAAWIRLGDMRQSLGLLPEACGAYLRAIEAEPTSAEAFNNLGNVLAALGRDAEALECYRHALLLRPVQTEAPVNLAAFHLKRGRAQDAEQWARRALERNPDLPQALSNLSMALLDQQRYSEAEVSARKAVAQSPDAAHLHSNLASVLLREKLWDEAEAECLRAIELQPGHPEASLNLGVILQATGRLEDSAAQFHEILEADPRHAAAWTNLGTVRAAEGRHDAALFCFEEALRIEPEFAKARFCRSLELLGRGRLVEGFEQYESRWKVLRPPRAAAARLWDGGPLDGATILLSAEQGLGDTIQFARYIPLVAARGGRVVVESQPAAAPIVRTVAGVDRVVLPDEPLSSFDVQAPLMSLPRIFGTTLETIPAVVPYVSFDPAMAARLEERMGPRPGMRVGLAWAGNPDNGGDRRRSMLLAQLEPLRSVERVEWFSLHHGRRERQQVEEAGGWIRCVLSDHGGLVELGALMSRLDLVITVDTMPAHLAGALGRPVWTLLCAAPDWRWMRAGESTPWYPGMRLFRQPEAGDWESVIAAVVEALRREVIQLFGNGADTEH